MHGVPAACVMVTVRPATVTIPTRGVVVGFAITDQLAEPLPVLVTPLLPTVIQGNAGFCVAVQVQVGPVNTKIMLLAPFPLAGTSVGLTL